MAPPQVAYVLLYRTPRGWRTTVAEVPRGLACGMLTDVPADSPFQVAAAKFEALLTQVWLIDRPLEWHETEPDWWGAEVIPGAMQTKHAATK